jgi:hypothetical protein
LSPLLALARGRAGDWPAESTHDSDELAGADAIVDDMDGIVRTLLAAKRLSQ